MQSEINKLYKQIQKILIDLIPEKWNSIYLYASIGNRKKGEMFFYYFPKRIIKTKPINGYEIARKFDLDEAKYNAKLEEIYEYIKRLNLIAKRSWTNLTISIKDDIFMVEYHYNNIENSRYTDSQRHTVWCFKYLNEPIESMNNEDRILVRSYKEESVIKPTIYTEKMNADENVEDSKQIRNQILKC